MAAMTRMTATMAATRIQGIQFREATDSLFSSAIFWPVRRFVPQATQMMSPSCTMAWQLGHVWVGVGVGRRW